MYKSSRLCIDSATSLMSSRCTCYTSVNLTVICFQTIASSTLNTG